MTTLFEILKHLDTISPRDYELQGREGYIEVGPNTAKDQNNTTVNRVLVTVYPSAKVVARSSQDKTNLIITFLPMLRGETRKIVGLDLVRLRLLTKNYTAMYVIGSSWIAAKDGLTDALADALNLTIDNKFNIKGMESNLIPIARICKTPSDMNHSGFANYITSKLGISNVSFTGILDDDVEDVLLCASNIVDSGMFHRILQSGIRTIVTGYLVPEDRLVANNLGLNVIEIGEFVTETPGMKRLRHELSIKYPELKIDYADNDPITQILRPYSGDMA